MQGVTRADQDRGERRVMRQIAYGPEDSADSLRVIEAPVPVPGEGEKIGRAHV